MKDITVNRFRKKRGKELARHIENIRQSLGRKIVILDVGGREDYWENVPLSDVQTVIIANYNERDLKRSEHVGENVKRSGVDFKYIVADARDLGSYELGSVDLVHANSVIEHVGMWGDMAAMARECQRVGKHGWVQTPAFEFPIEPHYRLPFVHWFGAAARRKLLFFSKKYRRMGVAERRQHVDRINLLSAAEIRELFPARRLLKERFAFLVKSYTAVW